MDYPRALLEDDVALELLPDREALAFVGPIAIVNGVNLAVAVNIFGSPSASTATAGLGIGVTQL